MAQEAAQSGVAKMLNFKILMAMTAAALGAALILVLPGVSPEVEAAPPRVAAKSDRLDARPAPPACAEQTWPYYQTTCLRYANRVDGQVRAVRIVTTDRLAR
jgi:hypothetical protein